MLKFYMDESGTHDGSPVVTVGGYYGLGSEWQAWTKAWNVAKRPIEVFHSTDCNALRGEFAGWDRARRDALVIKLLDIIQAHRIRGVLMAINLNDLKDVMQRHPKAAAAWETPYVPCFQWALQAMMDDIKNRLGPKRISVFHEINDFKQGAIGAFDWVKKNWNPDKTLESLSFGSKKDYAPLQAADILAYDGMRRFKDPAAKPRKSWIALSPSVNITARYLPKENVEKLAILTERAL